MKVKIDWIQKTGSNKTVCEDVVCISKDESGYFFAGTADGQSKKRFCVEGGQIALQETDSFMKNPEYSPLYKKISYPDELQYQLIHRIRTQIEQAAKEKGRNTLCTEFSSTLCGIAGNLQTGQYTIVHLGDGCILGLTKEKKLKVLSVPETGITRNHTYLTTSLSALTHLRFGYGELNQYLAFYILTDGADNICKDGYIVPAAKHFLIEKKFDELSEYMESRQFRDDASLVLLSLH